MPFWIFTYTSNGKPTVIGRNFTLESQAQRYVDENCPDRSTEIIECPTKNLDSAKHYIKAYLASKHHNVDEFEKRYSNKPKNKIEEEVEKPTYQKSRIGKGLLNRRHPKKRVSSDEPREMKRIVAIR